MTKNTSAPPFTPLDAIRTQDIDPEALRDFFGVTPEILRRLVQLVVLNIDRVEICALAPTRFAERCARIVSDIVCDIGVQPRRTAKRRHRKQRVAHSRYVCAASDSIAERWERYCVAKEGEYELLLAMVTSYVDRVYGEDVATEFLCAFM